MRHIADSIEQNLGRRPDRGQPVQKLLLGGIRKMAHALISLHSGRDVASTHVRTTFRRSPPRRWYSLLHVRTQPRTSVRVCRANSPVVVA